MAVQSAGIARSQYRTSRARRRLLLSVSVVAVAVVLGLVVHRALASKAVDKPALRPAAQVALSLGARQTADIDLIAGAVGQYVAANGALPTRLSTASGGGLVLCGNTCDTTAGAVSGLSAYQPSNIHLVGYSAGLTVPDQSTMYLVPGAKCGSSGHAGDPNSNPHSMVILSEGVTGTTPVARCLVL